MAGFLSMANLGRIAKLVALLLFVLPWVTVSCVDQTLATMTGIDLATGHVTLAPNPMGTGAPSARLPAEHQGEILVILGAVLIVAGLALSFVLKGARGAMAAAACAAAAAMALAYVVLVRVKARAVADSASSAGSPDSGGVDPRQIAEMIHVNIQIGFWLCLAALVAAVVFDILSMKAAAPPAQPPPAP